MDASAVIADFKQAVTGFYGSRLDKIILYGSRARGDFREDSDFDFAIVLRDHQIDWSSEFDNVSKLAFPLSLKYDTDISYLPINNSLLNQPDKVLYHFIRTEGKVI